MRRLSHFRHVIPLAQRGLSLIELMIAMAIGLFMLAGIVSLVVSVSRTRIELDKTSEQIENGRYAVQLLTDDLHNAGFYGVPQPPTEVYTTPSPCVTAAANVADLQFGYLGSPLKVTVPVPVFGYTAVTSTNPSCLDNPIIGSEALVVRQVATTAVTAASVGTGSTTPFVQTSANAAVDTTQALAVGIQTADLPLHAKDSTIAAVRAYTVRTYYLSDCNQCGVDTTPTLKAAEFANGAISILPLVEGIQDFHIEYGLDLVGSDGTSATQDGAPDCYVTDPGATAVPAACNGIGTWTAALPNNWINVTSVRISLLARSIQPTPDWDDSTRKYDLGRRNADGSIAWVGPFSDHYKRQVYSTVVTLNNPRGARE